MRILILGGVTFHGRAMARQLMAEGHDVILFNRRRSLPPELSACGHRLGDRHNPNDLKQIRELGAVDAVIDNIAFTARDVETLLPHLTQCGHYLLTSTISVYRYVPGRNANTILREELVDYSYRPADEDPNDVHWIYARGKMEAEKAVVHQSSLPYTIFRPTLVYGPDDPTGRSYWYLSRIEKREPIPVADDGKNRFHLVYSEDVAKAYLLALKQPANRGRTYNLAQTATLTLRRYIDDQSKLAGTNPQLIPTQWKAIGESGGPYSMSQQWVPATEKARKELAWNPIEWDQLSKLNWDWYKKEISKN